MLCYSFRCFALKFLVPQNTLVLNGQLLFFLQLLSDCTIWLAVGRQGPYKIKLVIFKKYIKFELRDNFYGTAEIFSDIPELIPR